MKIDSSRLEFAYDQGVKDPNKKSCMYCLNPAIAATPPVPGLIIRSLRRGFSAVLVTLVLGSFALTSTSQAVSPAPDGGYPGENTAEGSQALLSLTTGTANTALGYQALRSDTTGYRNTAIGGGALTRNTIGAQDTATGVDALGSNTDGFANTANGYAALYSNTTGVDNTATGYSALFSSTVGGGNTADGVLALSSNTTGARNTAGGEQALSANTGGSSNTANGVNALIRNSTGSFNIGVGYNAGQYLTTGNNNIDIGNGGVAGEINTIRIGTPLARVGPFQSKTFIAGIYGVPVSGSQVVINSNGKLGVAVSSARYKKAIKPMDKASETLLRLEPVTFRYKEDIDPDGILQFGLVAEQVEKVNPDLVVRNADGKVNTVRYEAVNAMLLNEFLKEHHRVEEQAMAAQEQKSEITDLKKQIKALTVGLQKVSTQVKLNKPVAQVVAGKQ